MTTVLMQLMSRLLFFIRRNVYRLSLMMAIFCCIEIFMHSTDGTRPNYQFPWGHYVETLAAIAAFLFSIAYFTKIGPDGSISANSHVENLQPGEPLSEAAEPRKTPKARKK